MAAPVRPESYRSVPVRSVPVRTAPVRTAPIRPTLRVIEGGGGARTPVRYLVRRVAAVVCCALALVLGLRGAALGVSALVAPSASATDGAVASTVHVARGGDTLWGVATRYAPEVDPRVAIDDLIALNGGSTLQVGQRVLLPAHWF